MEYYVIRLRNVSFSNANYFVLNNINLDINTNSFNVIVGKSGNGKSTLLKLMSGILI